MKRVYPYNEEEMSQDDVSPRRASAKRRPVRKVSPEPWWNNAFVKGVVVSTVVFVGVMGAYRYFNAGYNAPPEVIESPPEPLKKTPKVKSGLQIPYQNRLVLKDQHDQLKDLNGISLVEEEPTPTPAAPCEKEEEPYIPPAPKDEIEIIHIDAPVEANVFHKEVSPCESTQQSAVKRGNVETKKPTSQLKQQTQKENIKATPVTVNQTAVQVGSFQKLSGAQQESKRIKGLLRVGGYKALDVFIEDLANNKKFPYRLVIGPFKNAKQRDAVKTFLKTRNVHGININMKGKGQ